MYNGFIKQLCMYGETIRILAKGYLPNSLITPLKLKENLRCCKGHNKKDKSRLWYNYKKTSSLLWYEISYFWQTGIKIW